MELDAIAVVRAVLADPTNLDHVRGLTTPDVRYVSLNDDNPELHAVMPWSGVGHGAEGIVRAFNLVWQAWEVVAFDMAHVFASGGDVAIFGRFTYRSKGMGKRITTPFAIRAEVRDGKLAFMQFMEDTFGTASSFRSGGAWRFRTFPEGEEISVGDAAMAARPTTDGAAT